MPKKLRDEYEVEDFLMDDSFSNYHFRLNEDDESNWRQWIKQNPDKEHVVKKARELIDTLSLSLTDSEYTVELNKIKTAIAGSTTDANVYLLHEPASFKTVHRKRLIPLALIVLAAIFGVGYFLFQKDAAVSQQLSETVNNHLNPLTLVLSDSTVVTLAPQSVLQYPEHFAGDQRNVYLKGEAQFSVKRNEKAPFKVYSENIVATVLGTVFNFKKSGDTSMIVELLKGKLKVQLNDKSGDATSLMLYPNEKAVYETRTHGFYKKLIDVRTNISFQRNNFNDIAAEIKKVFGITVINKSQKISWRFTGTFKNATAKEVIDNICFIEHLTAEAKADTIYIK